MSFTGIPIWKEAPFVRLLSPLIAGILIQWQFDIFPVIYRLLISLCLALIVGFSFISSFSQFKNYWWSGIAITILFIAIGGAITYLQDTRHFENSVSRLPKLPYTFVAVLSEPLTEKDNSFKTVVSISHIFNDGSIHDVQGNVIIYFQKGSSLRNLSYNSRIYFNKKLQPVSNSGNPGAFDYQRYCAFQQIFHQVYLKAGEYFVLPDATDQRFIKLLYFTRQKIVDILRQFINGEKEAGLAEALLIGYKEDLDKGLVQSYSNTGVVHIIAISGLHLGLIYWLLNLLLLPLNSKQRSRWVKAILVITGLWAFSFLAGGAASVCRSAVMFTFIVLGENIGRKTNIYNSLAGSAFLLLCFNPFWLWDAGFQLSYIAVLSIVMFMKPVYNWFYIKNKLLDNIWKMAAITISAQVLTTPISLFHFHQFPNYFLITNLFAVPLSSLIVLGEVVLCAIACVPYLAKPAGALISWLINIMNRFVEHMGSMPFAVTDQLQLSSVQLVLLYLLIFCTWAWILQKNKRLLIFILAGIGCFIGLKNFAILSARSQCKLVVYNVPRHQAIDFAFGRHCLFLSDSALQNNESLQNFHLKNARIKFRFTDITRSLSTDNSFKFFTAGNKTILALNGSTRQLGVQSKMYADLIIISGNTDISTAILEQLTDCRNIVFDSSCPVWKINKIKAEAESTGFSIHPVSEKGAFILNLN